MKKLLIVLITLSILGAVAVAQDKQEVKSEVESLKYENLRLNAALSQLLKEKAACLSQLAPLQAQSTTDAVQKQATDLVAAIEKDHPGYTLNVQTGDLVKKVKQ